MRTFFRETDYPLYLSLLDQAARRFGVAIRAYCLMPNHVHLVVVPGSAGSLAALARSAHRRYSRIVNARFDWSGHLWQERFHSFVMDDVHLGHALRYVHHNPVRAHLVASAADWPWSSARAYLGLVSDPILCPQPTPSCDAEWTSPLAEPLSPVALERVRSSSRSGLPLGDDAFVDELEERFGRRLRFRPPGPPANPADR
jgi:putative transposase